MSLTRKIAQNTGIQVIGKAAGMILSLITASMMLRYLGDDGAGQYTTVVSFLQIFGTLMDFGLYIVLVKTVADLDDMNLPIVNNIFTLRIVSGLVFLGIAPVIALIIGQYNDAYTPTIIWGIVLTTGFFFFISMNQLLSAIFHKVLRADWIAIGEFTGKIVLLAATIVVIALDWNVLGILATLVLSAGVNVCITFFASRRYVQLKLAFDWTQWKAIIQDAWPIALSIAFAVVYFKGDTVILTFFEPDEVVGWYGAPYKILEVLVTFPAMFAGLALPVITAAWKQQDTQRFTELFQRSWDAMMIVALPMVAGVWVTAPHIINIVAGPEFIPSIAVLRILIVATAAIFLGTLCSYVVVSLDKQRTMMWGYGFIALTSLIAYLYAIPQFGMQGAAIVTVYSEIAVVVIALAIIIRTTKFQLSLLTMLKAFIAACIMYATLSLFNPDSAMNSTLDAVIRLAWLVPLGTAVYGAGLVLLQAISKDDIAKLKGLRK